MATKAKTAAAMRWDNPSKVEQLVWNMRQADLPRAENRAILNRLYNGDPPFDEATAEENQVQINRNDLSGPNALSQARRQWDQAFLKPGNFFSVAYDSGPPHKRREWAHSVTRNANRVLRKSRAYVEQARAAGGSMLLHGIGPSIWRTRRAVVCCPIFPGSLMIPSETNVDFDNLQEFAIFQEWTPAQLYNLTHGPKKDPGWQMDVVDAQLKYVASQDTKQPNATAFQYMPERIEELFKQDMGWWGSDAAPTCDVWDFYFREQEDGDAWYRRIILDWGLTDDGKNQKDIASKGTDRTGKFLYTSENRKFAMSLDEIFHCQIGDCSPVFPQRFHSIRSMGWMLWGVCDLENRLHCKFSEALFENLMWFFSVASNNDLIRLQKADFHHMGVIPQGVNWLKAEDRFRPDPNFIQMGFARYKQLMAENASAFTQDFDQGRQKEMTATETMARVNSVNALVSGMMTLAYTYEEFKDAEIMRRLCIKGNPDPMAQKFWLLCMNDGVDPRMLDVDRMDISRERSFGAGNKTLEMAIVQFLQQIRKNVGPDGQRRIDHIAIETATDDANLAQEIAPLEEDKKVSSSMHDAELSTDRLMRGLPYETPPDAVAEDYVKVWAHDLTVLIQEDVAGGNMSTPEKIAGYKNMIQHIEQFIEQMSSNEEDADRVKEYKTAVGQLAKLVNGFEQRLIQQMRASQKNGGGAAGPDPKDLAKIQGDMLKAQAKVSQMAQSHAARTAQRQVSFEMKEQQADRKTNAEIRRENAKAANRLLTDSLTGSIPFSE